MKKLYLNIVSPEKEIYNGEVESVTLPGTIGTFTILPQHAPIVSSLREGKVMYVPTEGEEQTRVSVSPAFGVCIILFVLINIALGVYYRPFIEVIERGIILLQ